MCVCVCVYVYVCAIFASVCVHRQLQMNVRVFVHVRGKRKAWSADRPRITDRYVDWFGVGRCAESVKGAVRGEWNAGKEGGVVKGWPVINLLNDPTVASRVDGESKQEEN